MFLIQIKISSIRSFKVIHEQPRFYLRLDHFHYFISQGIKLEEDETEISINHKFYLPQNQPEFEVMLLLPQVGTSKKILGAAIFDARQWPIDQEKTRFIGLSDAVSVKFTIKNTFFTSLESQKSQEQDQSLINQIELNQKQQQINSQHNYLIEKNYRLKQEFEALIEANRQLQQERQAKKMALQKRNEERLKEHDLKAQELTVVKQQLEIMNIQISAIINLVNDHGEIEICNSILDLLAGEPPNSP